MVFMYFNGSQLWSGLHILYGSRYPGGFHLYCGSQMNVGFHITDGSQIKDGFHKIPPRIPNSLVLGGIGVASLTNCITPFNIRYQSLSKVFLDSFV